MAIKLKEGSIIDQRFKIIKLLGVGGMGTVYLAEQEDLGRQVALKIMSAEQFDEEDRERFIREGRLLADLNSPGIVSFYHFGTYDNLVYFAMEYVKGVSLRGLLNANEKLHWRESLNLIRKVCLSMQSAHQAGIVHRDLKPENILKIDDSDEIKIIDFGLGRFSQKGNTLTATGMLLGSPKYMSPEQCQGQKSTAASDTYAIGVILYELISGHVPYEADNAFGVFHKHINEQWVTLEELLPKESIPRAIDRVLYKSLAKEPQHRYGNLEEMANDITAILNGHDDKVTGGPTSRKTARSMMPLLAVAAIVVSILLSGLYLQKRSVQMGFTKKSKSKVSAPKEPRNLWHCDWEEIQSIVNSLQGRGKFLEARRFLELWLQQASNRATMSSESLVDANILLAHLMLADGEASSAQKLMDSIYDSVKSKADDGLLCKIISMRLTASGSNSDTEAYRDDVNRLNDFVEKSKTLTNDQRWIAYQGLIEGRNGTGEYDSALATIEKAKKLHASPKLELYRIRVLSNLNRVDEAKRRADKLIYSEASEEQQGQRALEAAIEMSIAKRWESARQLLQSFTTKRASLAEKSKKKSIAGLSPTDEIGYLQISSIAERDKANFLSYSAEWSMNTWAEKQNSGEIRYRNLHPKEWLDEVENSRKLFAEAKQICKNRGDIAGFRRCSAEEYCCLSLLGKKIKAETELSKTMSDGPLEESKATLAAQLWSIYKRWDCFGWQPEHLIPLCKANQLYQLSSKVDQSLAKQVSEEYQRERTKYGKNETKAL